MDPLETGSNRHPQAPAGIFDRLGRRRDDGRIARHDDDATDTERRLDDVSEHGHGDRGPQRGRQASLRVSTIRDDDRRHAAKTTPRWTSRSRRARR